MARWLSGLGYVLGIPATAGLTPSLHHIFWNIFIFSWNTTIVLMYYGIAVYSVSFAVRRLHYAIVTYSVYDSVGSLCLYGNGAGLPARSLFLYFTCNHSLTLTYLRSAFYYSISILALTIFQIIIYCTLACSLLITHWNMSTKCITDV